MDTLIITQRVTRKSVVTGTPGVLQRAPFVAIDLETTGASASLHRIVEVGAVKMDHTGMVLDTFSEITNPGADVPLTQAAQRVHRIAPHQIRSARPLALVLMDLVEFIGPLGVVAHNLGFENRFLTAAYERAGLPMPRWQGVCTLSAARKHLNSPKNSLGYLLDLLQIPAINDHRAANDAHGCGALLARLVTHHGVTDLEPLIVSETSGDDTEHATAVARFQTQLGATVVDIHGNDTAGSIAPTRQPPMQSPDVTREAFGGHAPTDEQRAIVDAFQSGESVRVLAVAGAGKTSTVLGMAVLEEVRDPLADGLYLAFNASVADEARRRAPKSLTPMTAHALARRQIQKTTYGALLGKLGDTSPRWAVTSAAIGSSKTSVDLHDGPKMFNAYTIGRYALQTVEKFCNTMDGQITTDHVPAIRGVAPRSDAHWEIADHIVPIARRAWTNLLSPQSSAVQFNHNHYLKLWAMTDPTIGRPGSYIIFDEAQDANPIMSTIVARQHDRRLVVIGDPAQAIYRFTGAVDALNHFPVSVDATLTQSWRFGNAIAEAANSYLRKINSPVLVRGNPAIDDEVHFDARPAAAVLARTNGAALAEVIASQKSGRTAALIGPTKKALNFCETARQLHAGMQPTDHEFAAFSDWGQLIEYVENTPNTSDIATMVQLIEDHTVDCVETALKTLVTPQRADCTYSTIHRAKGLEFSSVRIQSDFTITPGEYPDPDDLKDELHLAYVGLTRAQHHLNPGSLIAPPRRAGVPRPASVPTPPPGMLL